MAYTICSRCGREFYCSDYTEHLDYCRDEN